MPTVLLVTHDAQARDDLRQMADEAGWELVATASAEETWAAKQAPRAFDVVVLDRRQVDGAEVLAEIRRRQPLCEVVLFSAQSASELSKELDALGVTAYFSHPTTDLASVGMTLRNAVERVTLRREHALLQQRHRAHVEISELFGRATNDGLWEWDLGANNVLFSPRWKQMLGYKEDEIGGSPAEWLDRVHPEERDQLREELTVHLDQLTECFRSEHRVLHKDGEYRWMHARGLAMRDAQGKGLRLVGSQTDITAQKLTEERLLHDAFHDALTGLPNSALLRDRLERAAAYAKRRRDYLYAVLFLDIDRFKNINDSLGHIEGDQLLIAIAGRLRGCVRPVDIVTRLSGDEFTILLDDISDRQEAIRAAERMQRALALPFKLNNQEIYATASIGIAVSSEGDDDPYNLVRDADTAMYRAKSRGTGLYEVFNASMHAQAVHVLGVETSLRRALGRQEFRLHYQPIVALSTGKIMGFEALLRWYSPSKGIVQPQDFIPVAEETGLIIPIGRWVLREACRQMVLWQKAAPGQQLFMSVNISPRQFTQVDLVDQIAAVLKETGVDPKQLKLEITESLLIDNVESTAVMMKKLQNMNLRLCIDDFGTGYSSLSTLYQLPIHTLKVDRSFVNRINAEGTHGEIVDTIIMLAHNLGMDVIAEGIENLGQLQGLKKRNCEYGQGYFFSRPVTADAAGALVQGAPPWAAALG